MLKKIKILSLILLLFGSSIANSADFTKKYWKPVVAIGMGSVALWKIYQELTKAPKYEFGISETKGLREEMQDTTSSAMVSGYNYFGIFDGHGKQGLEVAKMASENLHNLIYQADKCPKAALINAFALTNSFTNIETMGGSTGLVSLINDKKMYIANLGDSRAVLCSAGLAHPVSTDLTIHDPEEQKRIAESGAEIFIGEDGNERLEGMLIPTRAFGDRFCKGIISVPQITEREIVPDDQFLILACDGLWDVVSNQDAVNIVKALFSKERNSKFAAKALVEYAFLKGSQDNISVIVIDLKSKK